MPCLDGADQFVHNGLHGFDLAGQMQVGLAERIGRAAQHILHRAFQNLQLLVRILGERDVLGVDLFGRAEQIYGMVADALEIADGVEQSVHTLAVGVAHFTAGQLDEIGAQCILIFVHLFLFLPHLLGKGIVPLVGQAHGLHHAHTGQLGHVSSSRVGAGHGHSRGIQ